MYPFWYYDRKSCPVCGKECDYVYILHDIEAVGCERCTKRIRAFDEDCPVCGGVSDIYIYVDKHGKRVGCDECIERVETKPDKPEKPPGYDRPREGYLC